MGIDIRGLVEQMVRDAAFTTLVNNPLAQFGVPARQYLGATLLPERPVPENDYVEESIQYRTIIANHGTRYSPVQLKQGALSGTFRVSLSNSDIGSQITGADYDALIRLLERTTGTRGQENNIDRPTMMAMQQIGNWSDLTINRPLLETNEVMRWQAIVDASVVLIGNDGYRETVSYPNPTGHRVAAGGAWSSDAYDPYPDIMAGMEVLAAKGYTVNRIITSNTVRSKLATNDKITARMGHIRVDTSNNVVNQLRGRASLALINEMLAGDDLPPMELYDLQYRTSTGSGYFLKRDVFVMIATTGRDRSIDLGDLQPSPEPMEISNTIGYTAVGRPAGQSDPGRVAYVRAITDSKPPRVEGEGWQTSLPVVTDPEAMFVITGIT